MSMLQSLRFNSQLRTQTGQTAHAAGMILAAVQLAFGVFLAFKWGMPYGSLALLSAFFHATAIYLIGRSLRRIVDRRISRRELATA